MNRLMGLVPLICFQCGTPIPADPDEIAWVCATCGQGLQLDDEKGLSSLEINFAKSFSKGALRWFPFWVAKGRVCITKRESVTKDDMSDPLWRDEQVFFVPAFDCTIEQTAEWGTYFLRHPFHLTECTSAEMEKVTLDKRDMRALAEFIILSIEAERKDLLKNIEIELDLEEPELWFIPFLDKGDSLYLGIR